MEYIEGYPIDEKEVLEKEGYDPEEIGTKLVDHYIKQVMDDGFSMQIPIREMYIFRTGKIVWIDMGMMGRLSDRDRELISDAIQGIAINDIGMIQDAVLALGEFRGKPDQSKLYEDISSLMIKYGKLDMGNIDSGRGNAGSDGSYEDEPDFCATWSDDAGTRSDADGRCSC